MDIIKLFSCLEWEKTISLSHSIRDKFDCGKSSLNNFLKQYARQADEHNTARTFVALDETNKKIAGYVSLANTSLEKQSAAGLIKTIVNPIPALLCRIS